MMHKQLMDYLTPMLGEATAANMLKHYCARMNLPVEGLKATDLVDLSTAMRPMLAVWLGSSGAAHVANEIAQLGSRAQVTKK